MKIEYLLMNKYYVMIRNDRREIDNSLDRLT